MTDTRKAPKRGLVDPECWDLAKHFLSDVEGYRDEDVQELAGRLQEECEAFCRDIESLQVRDA